MKVAILGASSQIARDLIISMTNNVSYHLILYGRCTESIEQWLRSMKLSGNYQISHYEEYGTHPHDVVINFIGAVTHFSLR